MTPLRGTDATPPRRRLFGPLRRHPWRTALVALLVGIAVVNVLAYRYARSMLVYADAGDKTPPPQSLSTWEKVRVLTTGVTVPRPALTRTPAEFGLTAETVRFIADDGVTLEGWLVAPPAAKGTVLLFHGYAASRSSRLPEAKALVGLGFAALLVDFRGSGGSDGTATTIGHDEARDVAAALRFARERKLPGPVVLDGVSMGGAAVLRAVAVHGADPEGVILESAFGRMLGTVRNRFALMGLPSFPAAELMVFWGGRQAGFNAFAHNPEEYARACRCPALLLHGSADRNARPEEAQAILDSLAGPKGLVVFEGVGHTSLYAANPELWTASVVRFVAGR